MAGAHHLDVSKQGRAAHYPCVIEDEKGTLLSMINDFKWYEPWWTTENQNSFFKETFNNQLKREVSECHPLYGVKANIIGRGNGDDALFQLLDDSDRVAQVHLTWSKTSESIPWPATSIYENLQKWYDEYLLPLHFERLGIDSDLTEFESLVIELACHKLETPILEQWIYNNANLENELGGDLYLDLIACNFSNPNSLLDTLNDWYRERFPHHNYDLREIYDEYE